jgi:hypothetical protein
MDKLDVFLLVGRPASGKSETIDFLKRLSDAQRLQDYHIAPFEELDDFVYVWQTFENDAIWERMGLGRRDTDQQLYFLGEHIWDFFIERIDLDFRKKLARDPFLLQGHTVIVEFSRGGENGYANAMEHLSDELLQHAALLYIDVSFAESLRKNRRRYRPDQADSILYHSLEDAKMERYYKINDWENLSHGRDNGFIDVRGQRVPFGVFHNEPEKTLDTELLSSALHDVTGQLVKLFTAKG